MSPDQEHRLEEIFSAARELPPLERTTFLDSACGGDAELRRQADSLLAAHEQAGPFLQPTVVLPTPSAPVEKPGDRIGRYKLLEQIGEGGFGVVWMAEQEEPVRRRVALKIIKLGMDTKEVVARFEAERQALAMMDHPHIASVFDGGATETGRPYFVMELVKGVPITHYCDVNQLSTRERLDLFMQVCQAVQHAHQKGVIHRDLKPSNILVTVKDDRPVPKVIDFGVAKATQARLTEKTLFTRFQQWIGTPAYMSPEQAGLGSLDVDTRSDVYSLGVLLYELLTGRTPFDTQKLLAAGYDAVMRTIREDDPPKPSTRLSTLKAEELSQVATRRHADPAKLNRLVRGDLDWIVMKALEKDRTRRYETANAFVRDIEYYLNHEPVSAAAPTVGYRLAKFARRNRAGLLTATAFAALLVAAAAIGLWQAFRATQNAREADRQRIAATNATARAEAAKRRSEETLIDLELQRVQELFAAEEPSTPLAYLARILRQKPDHWVAAQRLLSALLNQRSFSTPLIALVEHEGPLRAAEFSPDGKTILTASDDGTARVWDALTGSPWTDPLPHAGPVLCAHFSLSGARVVTASKDQTARVWDAKTGYPLTAPLKHSAVVHSAQFSPEGERVVTASADQTAVVWHVKTGAPLILPLKHRDAVVSACFDPKGMRIVTASSDGSARVWDAQTGEPLTPALNHADAVTFACFSPDGQNVLTTSKDKTARLWNVQTGEPLTAPLRHEWGVSTACFSGDGRWLITGRYGHAQLWDAKTGRPLLRPLEHFGNSRVSVQFSPDCRRVLTATDRTARVWDVRTGQLLTAPIKHEAAIVSAQFSPDGRRVVTASEDKTARVRGFRTGLPLIRPLRHSGLVQSARFSPDGLSVATASWDGTVRVWDSRTGDALTKRAQTWEERRFSVPTGKPTESASTEVLRHDFWVHSAEFSSDGLRIVTASGDTTARVWDARTGLPLTPSLKHRGEVYSALFSPDGRQVLTASFDTTAQIWDAQTGKPLFRPLKHEQWVFSGRYSGDGRRIVTASLDKTARIWDARTGDSQGEPLRHAAAVRTAEFSPNGRLVLTASDDGTARLWDVETRQVAVEMLHAGQYASAHFSPDGSKVATASSDKSARIWDAGTGRPVGEPLKHGGGVHSVQFSPDGRRLATASEDNTACIWDVDTGHPLSEPLEHQSSVRCVQFSPDGQRLVTGSSDDTAQVWEVPCAPVPVPEWMPRLAEAVAGKRIDERGVAQVVAADELAVLEKMLAGNLSQDFWSRWGRWYFAGSADGRVPALSELQAGTNALPSGAPADRTR
jgi:eukaryotic-like serine/threonine-protein kinase